MKAEMGRVLQACASAWLLWATLPAIAAQMVPDAKQLTTAQIPAIQDARPARGKSAALDIVAAMNARDAKALGARINVDALGARVLHGLALEPQAKQTYLDAFKNTSAGLGQSAVAQLAAMNAVVSWLRSTSDRDTSEHILRIDMRDRTNYPVGHNYWRVMLDKENQIVDWYDYALAAYTSDVMRMSSDSLLSNTKVLATLFGGRAADAETAVNMRLFATYLKLGNQASAYRILHKLPASMQTTQLFANLDVVLSRAVGGDAYAQSLARLAEQHGETADLQFVLIDHYFMTRQFENVLKAIDTLLVTLGEDEVLQDLRCTVFIELARYPDAHRACARALAINRKFESTWWGTVRIYLAEHDAKGAVDTLKGIELELNNPIDAEKLGKKSIYSWLATQPEFQAWIDSQNNNVD